MKRGTKIKSLVQTNAFTKGKEYTIKYIGYLPGMKNKIYEVRDNQGELHGLTSGYINNRFVKI